MSSKNEARLDAPTITRRRHVLACARCRARRVKCDRAQPSCSNCVKAGSLCQPAQPQSTSLPIHPHPEKRDSSNYNRTPRYDDESNPASREVSAAPSPEEVNDYRGIEVRGRLNAADDSSYLSPFSWAVTTEQLLENNDLFRTNPSSPNLGSNLTNDTCNESYPNCLPNEPLHESLLNAYHSHVDPLVRVLHWPSFMERARAYRMGSLPRHSPAATEYQAAYFSGAPLASTPHGTFSSPSVTPNTTLPSQHTPSPRTCTDAAFTAVLYSVYYAAAVCIVDSPLARDFQGVDINQLTAAFKKEVESRVMDLSKSSSKSIAIERLQAMVIYLTANHCKADLNLASLQLTIAIRIAQSIGLHRDPSTFQLRAIDIEIRRRLWAQLCILDIRIAEQLGNEPSLLPSSYDTILPLNLDDTTLAQINENEVSPGTGGDATLGTLHQIENSQHLRSSLSSMTFFLMQAEVARIMAILLSTRYRARDAFAFSQGGHPRPDRLHLISQLEHRLRAFYPQDAPKSNSPVHAFNSEATEVNIAKVRFLARLLEWKDCYNSMSEQRKESESLSIYRDAIGLSARTLSFIQTLSSSPFKWYSHQIKDVYSSSFIIITLLSNHSLDTQLSSLGRAALDQLFPPSSTAPVAEWTSPFERLLFRARSRSSISSQPNIADFQISSLNNRPIDSFQVQTSGSPWPTSMPTSSITVAPFPSTGNLFEDYDTMMSESMWGSNIPGMENPYGPWTAQSSSERTAHFQNRQASHSPPAAPNYSKGTNDQLSAIQALVSKPTTSAAHHQSLPIVNISAPENLTSYDAMDMTTTSSHLISGSRSLPPTPLQPSTSWPLEEMNLAVRSNRERSVSQPQQPNFLDVHTQKITRTKSLTSTTNRAQHGSYQMMHDPNQGLAPPMFAHHQPMHQTHSPFAIHVGQGI